jgi:hypothetical protein
LISSNDFSLATCPESSLVVVFIYLSFFLHVSLSLHIYIRIKRKNGWCGTGQWPYLLFSLPSSSSLLSFSVEIKNIQEHS